MSPVFGALALVACPTVAPRILGGSSYDKRGAVHCRRRRSGICDCLSFKDIEPHIERALGSASWRAIGKADGQTIVERERLGNIKLARPPRSQRLSPERHGGRIGHPFDH